MPHRVRLPLTILIERAEPTGIIYLRDTNTCVYMIKRDPRVLRSLQEHSPDDFAVSAITVAELWFGAAKSSRPQQTRSSVDSLLNVV